MNKLKTFRVNYKTEHGRGSIMVYVSNFFSSTTQTNANKLLKLAKANCTEAQRIALIADLEEAKQAQYMQTKRDRIERCIRKIETQKWCA